MGPSRTESMLALLLAGVAGFTDAVAYITLHVFVANFTGTVVLLGIAAAHANRRAAWPGSIALLGFFCGIVCARLLRRMGTGPGLPLLLAAVLLLADAMLAPGQALSILLLAPAMGLQNAAVRQFAGVSLNTAFVTGDMQNLGEAVAGRIARRGARPPEEHDEAKRIGLIVAVLVSYASFAAAGAAALHLLGRPLLIAAALMALAALLAQRVKSSRASVE